jgi:hypothetical protein
MIFTSIDKRRIYFRTFTMQKVIFSSFITQTLDPKKEKSKSISFNIAQEENCKVVIK